MVHIVKNVSRFGTAGVATAALATLGFAGTASASSLDTTGPWSDNIVSRDFSLDFRSVNQNNVEVENETEQEAETGNAIVGVNTGSGGYGNFWGNNNFWNNMHWNQWNPHQWENRDFNSWWGNMNSYLARCNFNSMDWRTQHYGYTNWQPSGHNWQDKWENWNPQYWRENGASFQDWYNQFHGYMNNHYGYWQKHWGGYGQGHDYKQDDRKKDYDYHKDYGDRYERAYNRHFGGYGGGNTIGGSAVTGDARNVADTSTVISISNTSGLGGYGSFSALGGGAATNGKIYLTGPGSYNVIRRDSDVDFRFQSDNNVNVENETEQEAETGNAVVAGNTIGGGAFTGDATNVASTSTQVRLANQTNVPNFGSNWGGSLGSIGLTGPGSTNVIRYNSDFDYRSVNQNDVNVENETEQEAETGDARVVGNTIGGSAVTGDATNRASTSTTVVIRNQ